MDSVPKASSIQTGRTEKQNFQNDSNKNLEVEQNIETPEFVNYLIQTSNGKDEEAEEKQEQQNDPNQINSNRRNKRIRYNINNLFWLINEDLWDLNHEYDYNEAQFVILAHNLDFGNLKITYYSIPNGAIEKNMVFQQSLQRLVSGTVYPSSCFRVIHSNTGEKITCMEQLVKKTNEKWEKERPFVFITRYEDYINVQITNITINKTFWFNFKGWQMKAFEHSLNYVYTEGFKTQSICNVMKNIME